MLRVKSFKMSDDVAMNELLSKTILVKGANILVSNGEIVIPFEDGEPENVEQKIIVCLENKHRLMAEREVFEHSSRVINNKLRGASKQLFDLEKQLADLDATNSKNKSAKEVRDTISAMREEVQRLKNVIKQYETLLIKNQAEITDKTEEIRVYEEDIEALKK